MNAEQGEDASVANASNWLRLIFHALTCNSPACVLEERCSGGKVLLSHVLGCTSLGACAVPSCTSVRRLTLHWLRCQDVNCRLCSGVWRDLSGYHDTHEQHERVTLGPRERSMDPMPPEAPSTPDHHGFAVQMDPVAGSVPPNHPGAAGVAPSGRNADRNQILDVDYDPHGPLADRAVIQLQEATSYMRYLLHCLMCRNSRDAAARGPGLHFWLNVLLPQAPQAAAGDLAPPAAPAGRRLMTHRLSCRNSFCALCTGTCELFTRGLALRQELPVPAALRDMDQIVQELSLALGSVNL